MVINTFQNTLQDLGSVFSFMGESTDTFDQGVADITNQTGVAPLSSSDIPNNTEQVDKTQNYGTQIAIAGGVANIIGGIFADKALRREADYNNYLKRIQLQEQERRDIANNDIVRRQEAQMQGTQKAALIANGVHGAAQQQVLDTTAREFNNEILKQMQEQSYARISGEHSISVNNMNVRNEINKRRTQEMLYSMDLVQKYMKARD